MNEQETMMLTEQEPAIEIEASLPLEAVGDSADMNTDSPNHNGTEADEAMGEVTSELPQEEEVPSVPSMEELRTELDRLRAELEETKALHARMANELGEFHTLFPEVSTTSIPDSIWEDVKNGIPLAASYALYEKKCALRREHAEEINLRNAQKTPGAAGKRTPSEYFSADEVRQMSQSEVRHNYQKILESMKTWYS